MERNEETHTYTSTQDIYLCTQELINKKEGKKINKIK